MFSFQWTWTSHWICCNLTATVHSMVYRCCIKLNSLDRYWIVAANLCIDKLLSQSQWVHNMYSVSVKRKKICVCSPPLPTNSILNQTKIFIFKLLWSSVVHAHTHRIEYSIAEAHKQENSHSHLHNKYE